MEQRRHAPRCSTRYAEFGNVPVFVKTEDGRLLYLNDFAGLSIEQSNLMICLKDSCVPESVFPLVKRIISVYTNCIDANNAFDSLCASIRLGYVLWDVNQFNKHIPYKGYENVNTV